jgi:hypothetical protein
VERIDGPVLPGGVAVLYACFSGAVSGRAELSPLSPVDLPLVPARLDRMTALPTALLAHRQGPLAVIAHADEIIIHRGEVDERENPRTASVSSFVRLLLERKPLGEAVRSLNRMTHFYLGGLERLQREAGREELAVRNQRASELLRTFIRWHDSRNWLLLGDPAISLRATPPAGRKGTLRNGARVADVGVTRGG